MTAVLLLRRYMMLCEKQSVENIYAHVSPGANLQAIMQQGLVPNVEGGNYSGYWASGEGVYVTHDPNILRQHVFVARDMGDHYLIVLVQVGGRTIIDEDHIDNLLMNAANAVLKKHRMSEDQIEEIEMETELGQDLIATFQVSLGQPDPKVLARDPGIVEEFIEAWLSERIYGGDGPGDDWWVYAKDFLIKAFPALSNDGEARSLRIPKAIGYRGTTRIIAVIEVTRGVPQLRRGTIPPSAQRLINGLVN